MHILANGIDQGLEIKHGKDAVSCFMRSALSGDFGNFKIADYMDYAAHIHKIHVMPGDCTF